MHEHGSNPPHASDFTRRDYPSGESEKLSVIIARLVTFCLDRIMYKADFRATVFGLFRLIAPEFYRNLLHELRRIDM